MAWALLSVSGHRREQVTPDGESHSVHADVSHNGSDASVWHQPCSFLAHRQGRFCRPSESGAGLRTQCWSSRQFCVAAFGAFLSFPYHPCSLLPHHPQWQILGRLLRSRESCGLFVARLYILTASVRICSRAFEGSGSEHEDGGGLVHRDSMKRKRYVGSHPTSSGPLSVRFGS